MVTLGLHLFMFLMLVILMLARFPILPLVFDELPLDFRNNENYLRGLAWSHRHDEDSNNVIMEVKFEIFSELISNQSIGCGFK